MWLGASADFFQPQIVVLLGPIDVHRAFTHRLECALHADRADVDVTEHGGDEQHGNDTVDHLGVLHRLNRRSVEWEYQHIATHRDRGSTQHHDPIDELLAAVEAVSRRMVMPDHAAAALEPLDVDAVWDVAGDPHEEDQDDAEGERET